MPNTITTVEVELIDRIRNRDQTALSELYQQYGGAVYHLSMHIVQNAMMAEEIAQDTFLKVWNQAHVWQPERGKFSTWLLTITRYTAIDRIRHEKHQAEAAAVPIEDYLDLIAHTDLPSMADHDAIHALLGQLPPEQVQVLQLAYFQGMSHSQMAAHLEIPLGTVKRRVSSGLQKLRRLMGEANEDFDE